MGDWQPGDLALCVKGGPLLAASKAMDGFPVTGRVYRVDWAGVYQFMDGASPALWLVDGPRNYSGRRVWDMRRFRKVTPPAADEFDREVIDLMLGGKVEA